MLCGVVSSFIRCGGIIVTFSAYGAAFVVVISPLNRVSGFGAIWITGPIFVALSIASPP